MQETETHKTTIDPFHDVCIGQEVTPGEVVSGGIVIPEPTEPNVVHVLVLAAGPGVYDPMGKIIGNPVKVGDVVVFLRVNGTPFWDGNRKHWCVRANGLIGKLRRDGRLS